MECWHRLLESEHVGCCCRKCVSTNGSANRSTQFHRVSTATRSRFGRASIGLCLNSRPRCLATIRHAWTTGPCDPTNSGTASVEWKWRTWAVADLEMGHCAKWKNVY